MAAPRTLCLGNLLLAVLLLMFSEMSSSVVEGCGPGRGGGRRRSPRKLTPLVFKEFVPNVSENTLGASGLVEGKVTRDEARFKDLVPNYNQDIQFKDEEGTGADRLMTLRLKEKLNTLAISVMNQWPGVKLRVTEGWDEQGHHAPDSLHYEGRAVDITTSDKDRSKNGMLARLAVEAGFDWVYFESRAHIHASVKSEKSDASRSGGCFHGDSSQVETQSRGRLSIRDLRLGDHVLAMDSAGKLVFSPVLLFLDRDPDEVRQFVVLRLASGRNITLTPYHLLFVGDKTRTTESNEVVQDNRANSKAVFAKQVQVGQVLYSTSRDEHLDTDNSLEFVSSSLSSPFSSPSSFDSPPRQDEVVLVEAQVLRGVYAPLTAEGNLFVNQVLVSSYAALSDQGLAHRAFSPWRLLSNLEEAWDHLRDRLHWRRRSTNARSQGDQDGNGGDGTTARRRLTEEEMPRGVHWYPRLLYGLGKLILPSALLQ